jgi:translation initiation factor IF-3
MDADKEQLGIMPLEEALAAAKAVGLDLVCLSPDADPPVCRIVDYSKYRYEQASAAPPPALRHLSRRD